MTRSRNQERHLRELQILEKQWGATFSVGHSHLISAGEKSK